MGNFLRALVRRFVRLCKRVVFVVRVILSSVKDALIVDVEEVLRHARLFLGVTLLTGGLLSFASDRYCDGNASSYYACTRPSTYYFYPWWAIALVIIGSVLIVLWFLRRQQQH